MGLESWSPPPHFELHPPTRCGSSTASSISLQGVIAFPSSGRSMGEKSLPSFDPVTSFVLSPGLAGSSDKASRRVGPDFFFSPSFVGVWHSSRHRSPPSTAFPLNFPRRASSRNRIFSASVLFRFTARCVSTCFLSFCRLRIRWSFPRRASFTPSWCWLLPALESLDPDFFPSVVRSYSGSVPIDSEPEGEGLVCCFHLLSPLSNRFLQTAPVKKPHLS